jgi:hypothetical protein
MGAHSLANARSVIDLNSPGHYLNWSIFQVSVANLVVIGVMVVIFGLALLIPFPDRHRGEPAADGAAGSPGSAATADDLAAEPWADDADAGLWTARVRRRALRLLPPGKLLPDRQPAYVKSWINPFGDSPSADVWAIYLTGLATVLLLCVPFIPGLRDIPRVIPVHRLIWRDRELPAPAPASQQRTRREERDARAGG